MADLFGNDVYSGLRRSAVLSDCGSYRYSLFRGWQTGGDGRRVCWVMLNPSKANAEIDDPTIRRVMAFTQAWGFSSLEVRNLFALRATDPKELLKAPDPIGPSGNLHLWAAAAPSNHVVVCAWGARVPMNRDREAQDMWLKGRELWCLGVTRDGSPRHPLYVRADQPLVRFHPGKEGRA